MHFKIKKVERLAVKDTEKEIWEWRRVFICLHQKLSFFTSTFHVKYKYRKPSSYQYFDAWKSLVVCFHPHLTCVPFVSPCFPQHRHAQKKWYIFVFLFFSVKLLMSAGLISLANSLSTSGVRAHQAACLSLALWPTS